MLLQLDYDPDGFAENVGDKLGSTRSKIVQRCEQRTLAEMSELGMVRHEKTYPTATHHHIHPNSHFCHNHGYKLGAK
ncbi:hypothetical protein ACFQ7B_23945 [Streptomyces erythrochromogenes]|uniref:hypothetical protein n=1 Tax=Streptomyces erythrochromogenes TaxID=285574 RepID=UPI0036A3C5B9